MTARGGLEGLDALSVPITKIPRNTCCEQVGIKRRERREVVIVAKLKFVRPYYVLLTTKPSGRHKCSGWEARHLPSHPGPCLEAASDARLALGVRRGQGSLVACVRDISLNYKRAACLYQKLGTHTTTTRTQKRPFSVNPPLEHKPCHTQQALGRSGAGVCARLGPRLACSPSLSHSPSPRSLADTATVNVAVNCPNVSLTVREETYVRADK